MVGISGTDAGLYLAPRAHPGERGLRLGGGLGPGIVDQATQDAEGVQPLPAVDAVGEVLFHRQRAFQRQLTVEVGVKGGAGMIDQGFHQFLLPVGPTSSRSSWPRARERRDITVPMGTSRMLAISR